MPDLVLESLRGAYNDTDPPNALAIDECTVAMNVEFFYSTLGERRLGGQQFDLSGSTIPSDDEVFYLTRHFPDKDEVHNELWAFTGVAGTRITIWRFQPGTGWTTVTSDPAISPNAPDIYKIQAVSFDGKLFICAHLVGDLDRILVWDGTGTSIRVSGLDTPSTPGVANTGSGTFSGTRYYRIRYAQLSGSMIIRESEPSDVVAFPPSGTGAGVLVTRPALINEGETHWIVEASHDNGDFWQIATLPIATTTYTDTVPATTSYATLGELSSDIGSNTPIPSSRYIAVDDDRLVVAGSFIDEAQCCRAAWTPVRGAIGFGNAERIPLSTDNQVDLDAQDGGGITGISQVANGTWYAFKFAHIYSFTRTGIATSAYVVLTISKARGAMEGSIVSGMDEFGRACIYFADPLIGPSRIFGGGIQQIVGLRMTWSRVNGLAAKVVIRGIYYPFKQQVWWVVAVDKADSPNLGLKLQVNELRETQSGVKRGWTLFDGLLPQALTATVFTEYIQTGMGQPALSTKPFLGYSATNGSILRADVFDDDNGTAYFARIRTRPFFQVGLLALWGARVAALLAGANPSAAVQVTFIRDFGKETTHVVTTLGAEVGEFFVNRIFDDLVMSEMYALQVEFSDVVDPRNVPGVLYHHQREHPAAWYNDAAIPHPSPL